MWVTEISWGAGGPALADTVSLGHPERVSHPELG